VKLVHLVGFITKQFVTMQRGHMDVKYIFVYVAHGMENFVIESYYMLSCNLHRCYCCCFCFVNTVGDTDVT
jgi:hypothetical protein